MIELFWDILTEKHTAPSLILGMVLFVLLWPMFFFLSMMFFMEGFSYMAKMKYWHPEYFMNKRQK